MGHEPFKNRSETSAQRSRFPPFPGLHVARSTRSRALCSPMPNETIKQLEHVPASTTIDPSSAVPGSQGPDAAVGGEESTSTFVQHADSPELVEEKSRRIALQTAHQQALMRAEKAERDLAATATKKKRKKRSRGLLAWFTARDE